MTYHRWAPITDDDPTSCGRPQEYDADKEFKGKKVVLISVPGRLQHSILASLVFRHLLNDLAGAFTPGCQAYHLPPYIQKYDELKSKDVDIVAVIASNDCWVMCAWGKVNQVKDDHIVGRVIIHGRDHSSCLDFNSCSWPTPRPNSPRTTAGLLGWATAMAAGL